jgi:Tol biopolymer transport system component
LATDDIEKLLNAGIQAAKAGNKAEARRLLEQVLERDDNNENAWMWFASVVDTPRERRICLENVLEINPNNERARQALEKLKPNAITDNVPRNPPPSEPVRSAPSPRPSATARPLPPRPGMGGLRPPRRRRRITSPLFLIGIAGAVALIALGFLLLAGTAPPAPAPATGTEVTQVAQGPTARPTLTPNAVFVTAAPPETALPTWTPPPTVTPRPTMTATATLPPLNSYSLMFVGEGRGRRDPTIYTSDGTGGNEKLIVTGDPPAFDVAWSSKGKIAYTTIEDNREQIVVANEDGSEATVITKLQGEHARMAAWSPDGSRLAFVSNEPGNDEIYIVNADGSDLTRITENKVPDRDPAWSPDGNTLVYASDYTGKKSFQLFALDLQTKKTTQLTSAQNDSYSPAWSPDGKYIAFISTRDGLPNLYVMDADGQHARLLTVGNTQATYRDPAWSPDGKYILYASNKGGDIFNLFVMTPDGMNVQQLSDQRSNTYGARFRPK